MSLLGGVPMAAPHGQMMIDPAKTKPVARGGAHPGPAPGRRAGAESGSGSGSSSTAGAGTASGSPSGFGALADSGSVSDSALGKTHVEKKVLRVLHHC